MTVSTCPAVSGCGRNGSAGRRCSTVTSPFSSSHSPWVSVTSVPAGPRPRPRPDRRTHPLMFWPRSTTWRSALTLVTDTGRSSSTRRTGGAGDQTRRSKPMVGRSGWTGRQSPPPARRRSVRCPSIRSAASTCDGRLCHDGPVPVTAVVPSRKTMRSWPRNAVRDPHWSKDRSAPTWPRHQPSLSSTVIDVIPDESRPVTSYACTCSRWSYWVKPGVSSRSPTRTPPRNTSYRPWAVAYSRARATGRSTVTNPRSS